MAGRPTKLTPDLQREIVALLLGGNFVETVCDFVGINKTTFYDWMRRGERGRKQDIERGYVAFSNAVKKAMAEAEVRTLNELRKGPSNWQAKAWWLERRYPDKWGNRQKHLIGGAKGEPVEVKAEHGGEVGVKVGINDEQAADILGILASIGALPAAEGVGDDQGTA